MKKSLLITLILYMAFIGCSTKEEPDTIVLNPSEVSLKKGETHQISVTSKSALTYETENEFHAKVEQSGLVTANYVGETNIVVKNAEDSKALKVIVEPKSKLYPDPILEFGKSKSEIKNKYGAPGAETDAVIGYDKYSTNAPGLLFLFDEGGKCNAVTILVKTSLVNQLAEFIQERYVRISNTELYFADSLDPNKAKSLITIDVYNSSYYAVIYMDASLVRGARTSSPSHLFKNKLEEYINQDNQ